MSTKEFTLIHVAFSNETKDYLKHVLFTGEVDAKASKLINLKPELAKRSDLSDFEKIQAYFNQLEE